MSVETAAFSGLMQATPMAFLDEFKAMSPRLRQHVDAESHAALCEHMAHFRFDAAAQLLVTATESALG